MTNGRNTASAFFTLAAPFSISDFGFVAAHWLEDIIGSGGLDELHARD